MAKSVSGKHHTSGIETEKWHLLDHLADTLRETGEISFHHSRLYEGSPQSFKIFYTKRSKRRVSAMEEAVSRHRQNLAGQQISENKTVTLQRTNACEMIAIEIDFGMMVAFGINTNLAQLQSLLPMFQTSRKASDVPEHCKFSTLAIGSGRSLGEDGTLALCMLLRENFIENTEDMVEARHKKIASAYISRVAATTPKCAMDGDGIVV